MFVKESLSKTEIKDDETFTSDKFTRISDLCNPQKISRLNIYLSK